MDDGREMLQGLRDAGVTDLADVSPAAIDTLPGRHASHKAWSLTQARKAAFLEAFELSEGNLKEAIRAAGWSAETSYHRHRRMDARFKAEVEVIRARHDAKRKEARRLAARDAALEVRMERDMQKVREIAESLPPVEPKKKRRANTGTFVDFRKRYFGMDTPWFHHEIVKALEESDPGSITLVLIPPAHGKGLSLDTPLPTPDGWTTMGEVAVGDRLFDERGEPCAVTYVSPVHHRPCYRVTFSDGSSVVCDDEHLWTVRDRSRGYVSTTASTAELIDRVEVSGRLNLATPVHRGMRLEEADLPIDPYTLGCWLGDGSSSSGTIYFGNDDDHIQHIPYPVLSVRQERSRCVAVRFEGLTTDLRRAGLIKNKHLPAAYLRASEKQRTALLHGLMDTDGSCSKTGQCEFTSTSEALADGTEELIRSLGFKVRRYGGRATLYGKDCGPKYRLSFYPRSDRAVFRLQRKFVRQVSAAKEDDRDAWQIIQSIEPTGSVPTRCIQVDSPRSLYVAGRQQIVTHNTSLLEDWICYKLAEDPSFRVIYGSEKQHHGRKVAKRIKNRMDPEGPARKYVERFGPFIPQVGDDNHPQAWNQDFFDVWRRQNNDERDYNFSALGFGSAVAGTRCDLLVLDDPQSLKSLNQTHRMVEEFRQDWLTRPGPTGRTVILMTRAGEGDFPQRLMELGLINHLITFPAHDGQGRWLWPEMYSPEDYEGMKFKTGDAWDRNYMQRASAPSERTFTQSDIDRCVDPLFMFGKKPEHLPVRSAVVGLDPSVGGMNAYFVAGVLPDKLVALDWRIDRGLTSIMQIAQVLEDLCVHWEYQGVRVQHLIMEDKAFQRSLFQDEAILALQRRFGFSISGHQTGSSKYDEVLGIASMARSFRMEEVVLPGGGDDATVAAREALDADLARWRPLKQGTRLQQDLLIAMWFCWMRWRSVRDAAQYDDRSEMIRMNTPFKRPTTFRPLTLAHGWKR